MFLSSVVRGQAVQSSLLTKTSEVDSIDLVLLLINILEYVFNCVNEVFS